MKHQTDPSFEALVASRLRSFADDAPTEVRDLTDVEVLPIATPRTPTRRIVGIGASVVALAGGLTLTGIAVTGGEDGGSNTPEEAVRELVEAVENRDVLGALDVLDPGESAVMVDAVRELVAEGSRVGAFSASADASDVTGAGIEIGGLQFTTDQIATDLATVSLDAGTAQYSFDVTALPLTDALRDETDDSLSAAGGTVDFATQPLRLATVMRDGTWYVSIGYSIAEAARASADLPFPVTAPPTPEGFDTPEAAATALWNRLAALDLDGAIATAAPGEADALARYAPLWLPNLNQGITETTAAGTSITVADLQFDVSGDGDRRRLAPTRYVIDGSLPPADPDTGFPVFDPTQPTLVWVPNGETFYVVDAGQPLPDDFGSFEPLTEFPAELENGDVAFNSATLLPDGSVETYWIEAPEPQAAESPRPFRLEYSEGCTITSGALVDDALAWTPLPAGLVDLGDGRFESCGGQDSVGSFDPLSVLLLGQSGLSAPEIPTVQTVEIDGRWYVSPVGTIAEQLIDRLADVPDGGILSIDSPLAIYVHGTTRAMLERQLVGRSTDDIGTECGALVTVDEASTVAGVITDATRALTQPCVQSEEYWNIGGSVSVESGSQDEPAQPVASTPDD